MKMIQNDDLDFETFVSKLETYKNDIKEVSNSGFDIKVLATAAPYSYAQVIAKQYNFDACLATNFPKNGFVSNFENLGKQKKIRLSEYLKANALQSVDTFITDHEDDIPIVKMAQKNIIISPNKKFYNWLNENLINFEIREMK